WRRHGSGARGRLPFALAPGVVRDAHATRTRRLRAAVARAVCVEAIGKPHGGTHRTAASLPRTGTDGRRGAAMHAVRTERAPPSVLHRPGTCPFGSARRRASSITGAEDDARASATGG